MTKDKLAKFKWFLFESLKSKEGFSSYMASVVGVTFDKSRPMNKNTPTKFKGFLLESLKSKEGFLNWRLVRMW